jgi:hypothetical protein
MLCLTFRSLATSTQHHTTPLAPNPLAMPYHLVLKEASCVICRQSTEPYLAGEHQRVAAGMIPLVQVKCSFAGPSDTTIS